VLFIESGSLALVDEDFRNAKILAINEGFYVGETDLLLNNYIRSVFLTQKVHGDEHCPLCCLCLEEKRLQVDDDALQERARRLRQGSQKAQRELVVHFYPARITTSA
jgi:hypothetical protein